MLRKLMVVAAALIIPAALGAQSIPNSHASDTAKSKVAVHSQGAKHRASRVQGSAVGLDNRPVTPATPAVPATKATPATPATPSSGGGAATPAAPATPATPATPAVPPSPSGKPSSPGSSTSHRP